MMKKTPNLNFQECDLEGVLNVIFTPEVQHTLFNQVVDSIQKALKSRKKEALICDVNQIESSIVILSINFINVLKSSLEYFIKIEDYSMCTQISKLIKDLENG